MNSSYSTFFFCPFKTWHSFKSHLHFFCVEFVKWFIVLLARNKFHFWINNLWKWLLSFDKLVMLRYYCFFDFEYEGIFKSDLFSFFSFTNSSLHLKTFALTFLLFRIVIKKWLYALICFSHLPIGSHWRAWRRVGSRKTGSC